MKKRKERRNRDVPLQTRSTRTPPLRKMPPRGERKEGTHRPKVAPPEGELKTLSLHPDLRLRRA
ncbi:MAG TPA: hypothetical protein PK085_02495, partial [bacterium]|nr:hypothetical protein [bacterium]